MGGIMNGMALHGGVLPVGGTFFVFSDYMRGVGAARRAVEAEVIFVWTHDSVGLGEDGPTHQPIEQLAALRAMPRLRVIRPGRRQRDRAGVAHRGRLDGPDRADPHPPERAGARRTRRTARSSAARTSCPRRPDGEPDARAHRHRQRGVGLRRGRRDAEGGGRRRPRRVDALVGALRGAATRATRCRPAAGRPPLSVEAGATLGWER